MGIDLIYAALIIWAIKCLFSEGFLLHGLTVYTADWPEWVKKPLYLCPPCMSSVWGTIYFVLTQDFDPSKWVMFCVMLCGLNFFIVKLTSNERIIVDDDNT